MSPHTPLRVAVAALFLLYLVPWVLLAYSLHEGLIRVEPGPDGSLIIENFSPLRVRVGISLYSGEARVGGAEVALSPGSERAISLDPESLRVADRMEMTLSTMGLVEVRAAWTLTGD